MAQRTSNTTGTPAYGQSYPAVQEVIAEQVRTPETKASFKTSEFLIWGLGVNTLLLASAVIDNRLDAPLTWRLITLLSTAYIISRGFAKAASARGEEDIRRDYGTVSDGNIALQLATPETKEFFKTSEFLVWGLTVAGILTAALVTEVYDAGLAFTHATWVSGGYMIARGLAKLGTRNVRSERGRAGRRVTDAVA